jgi:hypothetical protein
MPLPAMLEQRLRLPVVAAPMFLVPNPQLVLACCNNGIVGSFAALNPRDSGGLKTWLQEIEAGLDSAVASYAINLIVHGSNPRLQAGLVICVAQRVPIIITSLGAATDVVDAVHRYEGLVFHDVTTRRHAEKAAAASVDRLIAAAAGAGSLTYALHATLDTPLNEVAVGSALFKPSNFESDLLSAQQAALWIASPVLKALPGQLPFLQETQQLVQRWNPNRQQAYYLYGGQWPATPISPAGLMYNALYGRSANQERLIGSAGTELEVDDWVFLRPQRSAGLFELFNQLVLLRSGRLVGSWAANTRT